MLKAIVWLALNIVVLSLGAAGYAQNEAEGKKLYTSYCAGCHGDKGKGDGPAATALPVKPANHSDGTVMNQLPDKFLTEIISKGGRAVGKSPIMLAWGGQFNEKQIRAIVAYIRSLAEPPYRPAHK
jgi:mono/diheme cytochrome c family protein